MRSRRNALKHGLTGEGIALPHEDQVEISRRYEALGEEFRPSTESSQIHLRRFAFLSVRLERCERHETSVLSKRVRHAEANHDDERFTAIEGHAALLNRDPMTASRRLQTTPEGIDWLVEYWRELRADLMIEGRVAWTTNHWSRAEALMGNPEGNIRVGRTRALTEAVNGFFANLDPTDGEGLDDAARAKWARDEIAAMIDAEVACLGEVRDGLDHEAIELDRAEAADRALFDASKEMILARKYEAATERAMYRALKEFHDAEGSTGKPDSSDVNDFQRVTYDTMASSDRETEPGSPEPAGFRVPPRRTLPRSLPTPPTSDLEVSNDDPKAVEIARDSPG